MSLVTSMEGEPHIGKAMWNSLNSKLRHLPTSVEIFLRGVVLMSHRKAPLPIIHPFIGRPFQQTESRGGTKFMVVEVKKTPKIDRVQHCLFPETLLIGKGENTMIQGGEENFGKNKLTCLLRLDLNTDKCQ